jgi:hypothetical protein
MRVLQGNFVNLSMPAGSTHFDSLIEFGRSSIKPFPVKFLSEKLKEPQFIRGRVYSGKLGEQIQGILIIYSPELSVARPSAKAPLLSGR